MSKGKFGGKIRLSSFNDLFDSKENEASPDSLIHEIEISKLHAFENHPFHVIDDEKMEEMVESVKQNGILVPLIVREGKKGEYEIISGHRRCHAAEIAGLGKVPAFIKNCSDDEAVVWMVDANIQREAILVSEKAKAYQMKYEALKHQGASGGNSLEAMSEMAGESQKTIQRLICLANLADELLELIDQKKIGIVPGVALSFLTKEEQMVVFECMNESGKIINMRQAELIKEAVNEGFFSKKWLMNLMEERKKPVRKIVLNNKRLSSFFSPDVSDDEIEETIINLLTQWKRKGGRF